MAARIHPGALLALIFCVIFLLAFTALVIVKSGEVKRQREGDPEKPAFKTVDKLRNEVKEEQRKIAASQAEIEAGMAELRRIEVESNQRGIAYAGNTQARFPVPSDATEPAVRGLILAPRTTREQTAMINGQQIQLPNSPWQVARDKASGVAAMLDGEKAAAEKLAADGWPDQAAAIAKHGEQFQAILAQRQALEAAYQADQTKLNAALDDRAKQKQEAAKIHLDDVNRRQNRILQLEERIRELLELELKFMSELEPVASIIGADTDLTQVVIDIGSAERVQPGLLFEVFNYDKGRFLEKGMIEVIQVADRTATCRVLSVIDRKRQPVAKGDRIGNPIFNPRQPKVFVIAPPPAEFSEYNRDDLADFIRRTGGVVRDRLGPGCDFLVVRGDEKDRSDAARAQAREYHILAIREAQLLKYVQKTFSPKPTAANR